MLLNGRFNNLVYGSYAPGAPAVFMDDPAFQQEWSLPKRCYLVAEAPGVARIEKLIRRADLNLVAASGGKFLLTNHPLSGAQALAF